MTMSPDEAVSAEAAEVLIEAPEPEKVEEVPAPEVAEVLVEEPPSEVAELEVIKPPPFSSNGVQSDERE